MKSIQWLCSSGLLTVGYALSMVVNKNLFEPQRIPHDSRFITFCCALILDDFTNFLKLHLWFKGKLKAQINNADYTFYFSISISFLHICCCNFNERGQTCQRLEFMISFNNSWAIFFPDPNISIWCAEISIAYNVWEDGYPDAYFFWQNMYLLEVQSIQVIKALEAANSVDAHESHDPVAVPQFVDIWLRYNAVDHNTIMYTAF